MQHHYRLPGGTSIVCHVLSPGASSARSDCVYWRPSGPVYVPVAGSYSAAAIGGGGGGGGAALAARGGAGGGGGGVWLGPRGVGGAVHVLEGVCGANILLLLLTVSAGRPRTEDTP